MIFCCYLLLDVSLHADGINYSESSLKIYEFTTPPSLAFKKIKTRHPTLTLARRILENKRGRSRLLRCSDSFLRASLFHVQKVILFFAIIAPMTSLPVLHVHPFCGSHQVRARERAKTAHRGLSFIPKFLYNNKSESGT